MAESMARAIGGGRVEAFSAGLAPAGFVAAPTVSTLDALGYPTDNLRSEGLEALSARAFDVVISLAGERGLALLSPALGSRRVAWEIADPFGEDDAVYLRVARQIEARVRALVEEELARELGGR